MGRNDDCAVVRAGSAGPALRNVTRPGTGASELGHPPSAQGRAVAADLGHVRSARLVLRRVMSAPCTTSRCGGLDEHLADASLDRRRDGDMSRLLEVRVVEVAVGRDTVE